MTGARLAACVTTGETFTTRREMTEELTILENYRIWFAENRPYWLDSILARYDQAALYLAEQEQGTRRSSAR